MSTERQRLRERMMVRQMHVFDRMFPQHRPWEELAAEARATSPRCICSFMTDAVNPACPATHERDTAANA